MSQIDISQWKEFKVSKLFKPFHGKRLVKKNRIPGKIPFLTAGFDNQGVTNYLSGNFQIWHKPITIDMFGNCFYHDFNCTGDDNVYALVNDKVSNLSKLFIASVLNTQLNIQFSYKDQFRQNDLDKLVIKLPVDSNGDPDWQYMDTYIAKLTALAHKNVSSLKQAKAKPAKLNIDNWVEFKIRDILSRIPVKKTSYKATDLVKEADSINTIPLVAAGVNNQCVTGYAPTDNLTILQNCLTVSANGANSGTVFYQNRRFSILQDAYALELINKAYRIDTIYIYLASLLTKLLMQNDWTNKATWNIVKDKHIKLPIDAKGEPDWEYMDNQVRHFATLSNLTIASLSSVI